MGAPRQQAGKRGAVTKGRGKIRTSSPRGALGENMRNRGGGGRNQYPLIDGGDSKRRSIFGGKVPT